MRIVAVCVLALVLGACAAGQGDEASTQAPPDAAGEVATTVATTVPTTVATTDVGEDTSTTQAPPLDRADCPEVVAVEMSQTAPGVFTVNTTVRSVDIEGISYADAWEVRDLDGEVYGERILTHPHANEQPFTRSLSGVAIPADTARVEVAARDSVRGFCGAPLIVEVPHS